MNISLVGILPQQFLKTRLCLPGFALRQIRLRLLPPRIVSQNRRSVPGKRKTNPREDGENNQPRPHRLFPHLLWDLVFFAFFY